MIKYINIIKSNPRIVTLFIIIFYCVGVAGFILPITTALFIKLIPLALLLSFVLLIFFHDSEITKKHLLTFAAIFICSFTIESFGVNTGIIFGNYTYGEGLGLMLFKTPLIIGINWLFLVYTSAIVLNKVNTTNLFKIILASGIMVVYDVVLEQMASKLDMWHWSNDTIPLQNYIVWFILAILFHSLFKIGHIKLKNRIAAVLLACQFMFFIILLLAIKLIS